MTPEFEAFVRSISPAVFEPSGDRVEFRSASSRQRSRIRCHCRAGILAEREGAVMTPAEAYAFDSECWQAEGFVALVENANGVGDYIAVAPADAPIDGERPVYDLGHDPMSVVRAADSFEAWVRESAKASGGGRPALRATGRRP